jgi:LppP/LprE lipoprotein
MRRVFASALFLVAVSVGCLAPPAFGSARLAPRQVIRHFMHATAEGGTGRRFQPVGPRHTIGDGVGGVVTAQVGMPDPTADGYGDLVFFFHGRRFLGWDSDRTALSIGRLAVEGDAFRVPYANYRAGDPLCCPSQRPVEVSYRWDGKRIRARGTPPRPRGNAVRLISARVRRAPSFTIRASGGTVTRIGRFRPRQDATIAAGERVFGPASSKDLGKYNDCRVTWRRLRLRIDFTNFGGHRPGQTTCSPSVGLSQSFSVRGRRFRTWHGLRVGQSSDSILDHHPNAEFRHNSWWLKTAVSPFGDQSQYPVVNAVVGRGRVTVIAGWIGAAGE